VSSEISGCRVIQVQTVLQAADVAPLGADHHFVKRLVPEVISEQSKVKKLTNLLNKLHKF
jgi:hypothetical protein